MTAVARLPSNQRVGFLIDQHRQRNDCRLRPVRPGILDLGNDAARIWRSCIYPQPGMENVDISEGFIVSDHEDGDGEAGFR